jgi:AAA family ATP:ADP antiporter
MSEIATPEFGKWRSRLWPVHSYELKKVLPMFFLFFFISFNYTILRDTKDTLIVTNAGAEAIPFLKFWGVVPSAVIFMLIYAKLSNILSKQALFYTMLSPFVLFFGLFATVIYPNKDAMLLTGTAQYLQDVLPAGLQGLVGCVRDWPYALFYILSELWGSLVLSLMFWGFANDIMKVTEAKRFYSLLGIGANIALMVSGPAIVWVSDIRSQVGPDVDAWQVSLNYLMGMVVVAGLLTAACYWYINAKVLTDPRFYDPNQVKKAKKDKPKMGMAESFKYLASSKYLGCIALLVIGYGVAINLVEVTWKGQLKLQYPNENEYSAFMGKFSTATGFVTVLMMMFVGGNALRRGWKFAAMITPVVLLITGTGFFGFVLFRDSLAGAIATLGTTPLFLAVFFGAAQNIMSKSAKYSLFDPTKEIAYIPLDQESKVKGKAAIDVVGARLGKSGGSLVQQGLLFACGSLAAITPYIAAILFVIIALWLGAVQVLDKEFQKLTAQREEEKAAEEQEKAAMAS